MAVCPEKKDCRAFLVLRFAIGNLVKSLLYIKGRGRSTFRLVTFVMPQVSKKRLHENLTLRFYQIISDGAGALEIVSLLLPILRC